MTRTISKELAEQMAKSALDQSRITGQWGAVEAGHFEGICVGGPKHGELLKSMVNRFHVPVVQGLKNNNITHTTYFHWHRPYRGVPHLNLWIYENLSLGEALDRTFDLIADGRIDASQAREFSTTINVRGTLTVEDHKTMRELFSNSCSRSVLEDGGK